MFSRLLAVVLLMEKSKNDVEFYDNIRKTLSDIKALDTEEMRIFNLFLKIVDLAYGNNRGQEVQSILNENEVGEADRMLCDLVENAKREKEELEAKGRLEGELKGKLEIAKAMLLEKLPEDLIIRITNLSKEQIEAIQ